jgi:4-amino-4-deoxy-L-arabinose transferase-like glycosyltransferase
MRTREALDTYLSRVRGAPRMVVSEQRGARVRRTLPPYAIATIVLIGAFVLMMLILGSEDTHVEWDEAVFIGIAKHIASNGAYGLFESFRPFLLPLTLVPLLWLGVEAVSAAKLVALLFSTATLVVTFLLARELADERTAFLATALVAVSTLFFGYSLRMMSEIPSSLFILVSLLMLVRRQPLASGVFSLLSFAMRYPAGLILPAVMLIAWIRDGWRSALRVLAGFIAAFIPLVIAYAWFLEDPIGSLIAASTHQNNPFFAVSGPLNNLAYYPVALIVMQPLFAMAFAAHRRHRILLIPIAIVLVYFTIITNKQERFILIVVPLIAIMAASALASIRPGWIAPVSVGLVALVLIAPIIITESNATETPVQAFMRTVELTGPVGTSDPLIAAYRNVQFVPIYFSYEDIEQDMAGLDEVLFHEQAYGCQVLGSECEAAVGSAFDRLSRTHEIRRSFEHGKITYRFFVTNNSSTFEPKNTTKNTPE